MISDILKMMILLCMIVFCRSLKKYDKNHGTNNCEFSYVYMSLPYTRSKLAMPVMFSKQSILLTTLFAVFKLLAQIRKEQR